MNRNDWKRVANGETSENIITSNREDTAQASAQATLFSRTMIVVMALLGLAWFGTSLTGPGIISLDTTGIDIIWLGALEIYMKIKTLK